MKYYPFNPKITNKDLEQGQAVSNAFWNACSMVLINEKEKEMAAVKYDLGDILTWCKDGNCYATVVIVRCEVYRDYVDGTADTKYDVFYKNGHYDAFELIRRMPDHAFKNYNLVGHIDISGMSIEAIRTELIYAIACVWHENNIANAVQEHWALTKFHSKEIYIPKMTDEYCCYSLTDKLKEECEQKQKHLDPANNKIFELKKEVDSLRQTLRDDSIRIYKNLSKMGFTEDAICSIMHSELNDI